MASDKGHLETVKVLLEKGANIYAAAKVSIFSIVKYLITLYLLGWIDSSNSSE
jgi:hypothetical protein